MKRPYDIDGIRAIVQHPHFEDLEALMREYQIEMSDRAKQRKETLEQTGMNTVEFGSKADAVEEIIERITEAAKLSFDSKKRKVKDNG